MEALVFFSGVNSHPWGGCLKKGFGHVWVAVKDDDQGIWISHDWQVGLPKIWSEAISSFDLAAHYKAEGLTVVRTKVNQDYSVPIIILNNCVGHTKLMLGISDFSFTPWQLYRQLTKKGAHNEII